MEDTSQENGAADSEERPQPSGGIWHGLIFWLILLGFIIAGRTPGAGFILPFAPFFLLIFFIYLLVSPHYYKKKGRPHYALYSNVSAILLLLILFFLLSYNPIHSPLQGKLTTCKSNLKNIGTALEMYETDFYGLYPVSLERLAPEYFKSIPRCPAARSRDYAYSLSKDARAYTVYCSGTSHKELTPENHPQYDSIQGLID